MFLGALLDLGLPIDELRAALGSLAIDCGPLAAERVLRAGVSATKFHVGDPDAHEDGHVREPELTHEHAHAHGAGHHHHPHGRVHPRGASHDGLDAAHHSLADISGSIERSALTRESKDRAIRLFRRLAEAEAAVHDVPLESVHLHEVGALDSIVDIVGAVHGMEWLGRRSRRGLAAERGKRDRSGARTARYPVPAPATARLLTGVPDLRRAGRRRSW